MNKLLKLFNSKENNLIIEIILSLWTSFVFVEFLFSKISKSTEITTFYFLVGNWAKDNSFYFTSNFFLGTGIYIIGVVELIVIICLLFRRTRVIGAFVGLILSSFLLFFYIFGLNTFNFSFFLVLSIFFSTLGIIYLRRENLFEF